MEKQIFKKKELMFALGEEIKTPDDECPNIVYVESTPWTDDGKYSHREVIYQKIDDGTYWSYGESRSGSYFSDYWYSWDIEKDDVELYQVHRVTKTIKVWEGIK